ncbi:MAG: bifunctional precorrin-2 dehydrogenase/sirohydrochlorin ferrochelatase [Actinomycetota bacterium]|nr:bifunctional precorrin-2 dehydrogenase/sirohydrochlorin ferrochelatase [Actinomycetota bacterium]MEE2957518.1 bifunctional precorrin-2 dehydrogenase/sirohydrochlorin ferrochelatase [Actinomycetota bacterium]
MPSTPYPVNLDLAGRRALVVGGGTVAARKVHGLLAAGADVTVVAPEVVDEIADNHRVRWHQRPYRRGEVAFYRLAISATGDPAVDGQVYWDAEAADVWLNSADDPQHCSFTLPAVTSRNDLQVTVSTNGRSPAVAAWLRRTIDAAVGPEHATVVSLAAEVRAELRAATGTSESPGWVDALDDDLVDLVRVGDLEAARRRLRTAVGLTGAGR